MARTVPLPAALLALLVLLGGCLPLGLSAAQDADLRAVFDKVRAGDLPGVEAAFDPQYRTPLLHQALPGLQHQIPAGPAKARLLKGVVQSDKGRTDYGGIYAYDFPHEAILVDVQMRQDMPAARPSPPSTCGKPNPASPTATPSACRARSITSTSSCS